MPDHYAHYRFGKQLLPLLPQEVRQCIQRFRRMYDTGLQGPDIFYYYNPFWKTEVGQLGDAFHGQSGAVFFTAAEAAADSEGARAYLYGLLAHYCLDAMCHPYVKQLVDIGEARHAALEKEFDRYLLCRDGVAEPAGYDISPRLKLTRGECMSAAALYPGVTGAQVSSSVKGMARIARWQAGPRRELLRKLAARFYPNLTEHFIPAGEVEEYALYVGQLQELYAQALEHYPVLLAQLLDLQAEHIPLGEAFSPNFG